MAELSDNDDDQKNSAFLLVLKLKGKAANRLMTWETIQKEDFLTAQNKIQKSSDSERLKRMSVK